MNSKHVAVRIDDDTLAKIDALIPAYSTPWHSAKRSDVLRALILAGLGLQAAKLPPEKPAKSRKR